MKAAFQETLHAVKAGDKSADDIFDEMEDSNAGTTSCLRYTAWGMNIVGHILLFWPIIKVLSWIPLVGGLLSYTMFVAACCCACVWGSMLHFLVLGVSWIVYRPLYGALLLTVAAVSIILVFAWPVDKEKQKEE